MHRVKSSYAVLSALVLSAGLVSMPAQPVGAATSVGWHRVLGGLRRPVQVTSPLDGTGRLFVTELAGRIRIVRDGKVRARAFLDLRKRVLHGYDEGLLSVAFDPRWREHPFVWVAYITRSGDLRVSRFRASSYRANRIDVATGRRVLTVPMPERSPNHYGGQLAFGSDGMLYLSTGDGGGAGDPGNSAQDRSSLRGKILRFDVTASDQTCGRVYCVPPDNPFAGTTPGNRLVWALGLRNPWRFSVDATTGNLWVGDVGDQRREEVDRIRAGDAGENLGWSCREGDLSYQSSRCRPALRYHEPRFTYGHAVGEAITGGVVYRGQRYRTRIGGQYVAGDFISGRIFRWAGGVRHSAGHLTGVSSFGEGPGRELYATTIGGGLYRVRVR